jgi:Signal transduction histidine kinase
VDNVLPDVDPAIHCGLIINELVSNSLKHAFPRGKRGEIQIALSSDTDKKLTLVVGDNGIGFPKDLDFQNTESLGLQVVVTLVKKLKGTIELDRSSGTEFKIVFSP